MEVRTQFPGELVRLAARDLTRADVIADIARVSEACGSQNAAAKRLEVSGPFLSQIVRGKAAITAGLLDLMYGPRGRTVRPVLLEVPDEPDPARAARSRREDLRQQLERERPSPPAAPAIETPAADPPVFVNGQGFVEAPVAPVVAAVAGGDELAIAAGVLARQIEQLRARELELHAEIGAVERRRSVIEGALAVLAEAA